MKKLLKFLTSRMVIVGLLIAIQLVCLICIILFWAQNAFYALYGLELLSLIMVIHITSKDDNPSYKIAWIIPILVFPIFGGLFYLIFGNKRVSVRMRKKILRYYEEHQELFSYSANHDVSLAAHDPMLARQAEYITRVSGFPVCRHTQADYLKLGEIKYERLLKELRQAKKFIFMEYFIIEPGVMWNSIYEILKEKVQEGVNVKLMFDDIGCIQTLPAGYEQELRRHGIQAAVFNPLRPALVASANYRDHRKICVIDGNVGFTGGINLADEYINAYEKHGHWKDTAVCLRGDAVWNLTLMFLQLWTFTTNEELDFDAYRPTLQYESDGYVQPFGDGPLDHINIHESAYMQMINTARRYVYITTPYLILDNEMTTALKIAAQSGVDVRIITPHHPDKWFVHPVTRANYLPLLEAGVHIYEYTPGFIHSKMYVSDDKAAIVGTANMDFRSFYLHFECGVAFYQASIVQEVKHDFLSILPVCTEVTLEQERNQNAFVRFGRAILRVFAPLM